MSDKLINLISALSETDKYFPINESDEELKGYSKRLEQFFDEDLVNYWNDALEKDPSLKKNFNKRAAYYMRKAEQASSPVEEMMWELRILLSEEKARLLAKEYYQKAIRSRTFNASDVLNSEMSDDDRDFESNIAWKAGYSDVPSELSIPAYSQWKRSTPERKIELSDLFDKLLNKSDLSRNDKLVLIARLELGLILGGRTKKNSSNIAKGLSLEQVMNKRDLPPEYKDIQHQINRLIDAGLSYDDITFNRIIFGDKAIVDDQGKAHKVEPLIRDKNAVGKSQKNLQDALAKIAGADSSDLKKIKDFLYVNEAKDRDSVILNFIANGFGRNFSISRADLITVIVTAVQENILANTSLSKSPRFKGKTLKQVCKSYLDKADTIEGQEEIQNLVLAPAIEDEKKELGLK